jgi:hypothetical protein
MYQYFLKVVPTVYSDVRNATTNTNQYSVTENFRDGGPAATGRMLPGVFFFYDLSPIKVGRALRRAWAGVGRLACRAAGLPGCRAAAGRRGLEPAAGC